MRSYFAKQGNKLHQGGWVEVLAWARKEIDGDSTPIKLFTSRAGEPDARIVAEISTDGERLINEGRIISLKALINGNK